MTSQIQVTITGADDEVNPHDLLALSNEFPFVEWGILLSTKRTGEPRYPTDKWIWRLIDAFCREGEPLRLARHLCGLASRETMQGEDEWLGTGTYCRVQVNGYEPGQSSALERMARAWGTEFILQCRSEDTLQQCANDAAGIPRASVLFDPSGGRGVEPMRWATTPCGCRMGFAGGIGPDNVLAVISDIGPRDAYWIDMESGVRTDDRFDLAKVRRVLEQVARLERRVA